MVGVNTENKCPKISVIVPAYNLESYLRSTIQSVLEQTYPNIEVVVVDDGSTDRTGCILDEMAACDDRIIPIHKENGGVTSARLCGAARATGEWIGFVDGDDYIESDMYERLLNNAQKYKVDISHCGYQMVFPSGRVDYYYNTGRLAQQDRLTALKELLAGSFEPGLCNKLFHKTLFHSLLHDGVMNTDIKINEDLLMNYYLFKQAKRSVYEDVCPYHYLVRKDSAANSRLNEYKLKDPLRVLDILYKNAAEFPETQAIIEQRRVYTMINVAVMAYGDQKPLIAPYRRKVRKELRQELWRVLKGDSCSVKIKLMALWTAVWPWSYRFVHAIYAKVTGIDKKYSMT